jgi:replicative DNA helicase
MLETINKFKNAILKSEYIKRLSEELKVEERYILEELKKVKSYPAQDNRGAPLPGPKVEISPTEKLLIKLMLEEKDLLERIIRQIEPADFGDARTSRIVSVMFDLVGQGKKLEPRFLMQQLSEDEAQQIISESMFLPEAGSIDREKVLDDCINRIKSRRLKLRRQALHEKIKEAQGAGDQSAIEQLMQEFHNLIKGASRHDEEERVR